MKFSKILTTLGVTTTLVTAHMIGLPNSKLKVAQAQTTGRMMIQAKSWMNLCLDIANPEGQGPVNGAPVIAFECHGGANQRFQLYNDGTIRAKEFGGLCLDIANPEGQGPVNGASVIAFECHGGANQRFSFVR